MGIERLTSRKNATIRHLRLLGSDAGYRRETGEYLCEGLKTLRDALAAGVEPRLVLWKEEAAETAGLGAAVQFTAPAELFDYAAPLVSSPGPLFTVALPEETWPERLENAILLENVQDPGNVGTVIRTANAFGIDAVVLAGACADLTHPRTVRATMGAIFRQRVLHVLPEEAGERLAACSLRLFGAALSDKARDLRSADLRHCAVAIGSEGRGLSETLLGQCAGEIIIPMRPESESLNAAVAASIAMWEIVR